MEVPVNNGNHWSIEQGYIAAKGVHSGCGGGEQDGRDVAVLRGTGEGMAAVIPQEGGWRDQENKSGNGNSTEMHSSCGQKAELTG